MNIVLTQKIEDGTDPQVRAETCPLALMGCETMSTSHLEKELGQNQEELWGSEKAHLLHLYRVGSADLSRAKAVLFTVF